MRKIYIFILLIVIFFPKITIINITGTYVGIRIEDICVAFFVLVYILKCKLNKKKVLSNKLKNIGKLFCIYIIFSTISTILGILHGNIEIKLAIMYEIRKVEYFLFIFIGYEFIKSENDWRTLIKIIDISLIVHIIIILLQNYGIVGAFSNGEYIQSIEKSRLCSTFNGPYEFAAYLLLLLPIYVCRILREPKNICNVIKYIITILLIFIGIYYSESRISLVTGIFMLIIIPILDKRVSIKKMLIIAVIGTLTIVITSISFNIFSINIVENEKMKRYRTINIMSMWESTKIAWNNRDFERYMEYGYYVDMADDIDYSFLIRINKWMALIDGSMKNPLFGLGISIAKEACDGNYIRIIAETGIIGLICWGSIIRRILKESKTDTDINCMIKYGMYSLLISAVFIDIFESSKIMMFYWFVLGCAYSKEMMEVKEKNENSTSFDVNL